MVAVAVDGSCVCGMGGRGSWMTPANAQTALTLLRHECVYRPRTPVQDLQTWPADINNCADCKHQVLGVSHQYTLILHLHTVQH